MQWFFVTLNFCFFFNLLQREGSSRLKNFIGTISESFKISTSLRWSPFLEKILYSIANRERKRSKAKAHFDFFRSKATFFKFFSNLGKILISIFRFLALLHLISHKGTAALFFLRFISPNEVGLFRFRRGCHSRGFDVQAILVVRHGAIFGRLAILLSVSRVQ